MNTNKLTAIFLTLLMVASIGYAQFMSSRGGHGQCLAGNDAFTQNQSTPNHDLN